MLVRREAIHRSSLVEKATSFRAPVLDRIDSLTGTLGGSDPVLTHHRVFAAIDSIINAQATLLSYADIFSYVALAFIFSLPLLLLLGGGASGKATEEAAAGAH
jgi:DHA2 family multidrug resistance protein